MLYRSRHAAGRIGYTPEHGADLRFRSAAVEEQPAQAASGAGRPVADHGDVDLRAARVAVVQRDVRGGALEAAIAWLPASAGTVGADSRVAVVAAPGVVAVAAPQPAAVDLPRGQRAAHEILPRIFGFIAVTLPFFSAPGQAAAIAWRLGWQRPGGR